MSTTIRTAIGAAGRIFIPKPIRDAVGLSGRDAVDVRLLDGGIIELLPVAREVVLVETDGIVVAVPLEPADTLLEETVATTREMVRRARGSNGDV